MIGKCTDDFMIIEAYNVSGYGSLRPYLACTKAHILLAQESHLQGEKASEASQAARRMGWKVVQSAATPGRGGFFWRGHGSCQILDWAFLTFRMFV